MTWQGWLLYGLTVAYLCVLGFSCGVIAGRTAAALAGSS